MENIIKEITDKIKNGNISKDDADKVLLNVYSSIENENKKLWITTILACVIIILSILQNFII